MAQVVFGVRRFIRNWMSPGGPTGDVNVPVGGRSLVRIRANDTFFLSSSSVCGKSESVVMHIAMKVGELQDC